MLVVVDLPPGGFSFPGYFSMLPHSTVTFGCLLLTGFSDTSFCLILPRALPF